MHSTSQTTPGRLWPFSLLMVTFAIGTDDFVVAGALPELSRDLRVSEGTAGFLVTCFSLTYAISAPFTAVITARLRPLRLLFGGLAVFALLNVATAFAPTFGALMALRIATAAVAGTLSPAAFAIAGQRSSPGGEGRAIGVVAAGLTVSLALGVPVGTWLSGQWGWHATFLAVAGFTLAALACVGVALPDFEPVSEAGLQERLQVFRTPAILACAGTTTIGACAGLMPYTYIAPISAAITGRADLLTFFIAAVGIAGALGATAGGRISDRWGPDRAMIATFGGALLAVLVMALVDAAVPRAWPGAMIAMLAVWGVAAWGNNAPMNARTLLLAGDDGTQAMALNTSGLYAGIAVGSALGGMALTRWGAMGPLVACLVIGVLGLLVMVTTVARWPAGRPLGRRGGGR